MSEYRRAFREGLAHDTEEPTFIESINVETFPIDEGDRQKLRDTQRGFRDGKAARLRAMREPSKDELEEVLRAGEVIGLSHDLTNQFFQGIRWAMGEKNERVEAMLKEWREEDK